MYTHILKGFLERDLELLKKEITAYQNEENIWKVNGSIHNSAGNLCLHLVGNLNHFIGTALGNSGYVRDRDAEFSIKNVSREELLKMVHDTQVVVAATLNNLTDADLEKDFPYEVMNQHWKNAHFLFHLSTHLTYHLGQINYHRRLLD
ncbi:DinB family protein [Solitalea koreensis]|uniref:DinB superfamily protein n=1 Tax=Solitalea koreensis TaxID=543615 RepID=A0A521C942_9SPHI|nr:DUF1572 family protein [Solitalea koreensis]SMO55918.1 Protein of unknown function [Solitalea koreensis]